MHRENKRLQILDVREGKSIPRYGENKSEIGNYTR